MNRLSTAVLVFAVLGVSSHVSAQDGIVVHGSLTTAISGGDTNAAISAGAGYEWGPLRLGGEVTRTTKLPPNFVHILGEEAWTRVTALTANARIRLPLGTERVSAYALGGLGTAWVTDAYTVFYVLPGPNPITTTYRRTVFAAGGGVNFPVAGRVSLDAEARVLRVTGDRARSIGRLGGGVTVRF